MKLFFITTILMAFVFCAIGIKILMKKKGEFAGTCASQNPFLDTKEPCGYCGKIPEECENSD